MLQHPDFHQGQPVDDKAIVVYSVVRVGGKPELCHLCQGEPADSGLGPDAF